MPLPHASTLSRCWLLGLSMVLALLGLIGTASACTQTHPTALPWLGNWEDKGLYYLRAQSATNGPFLGTEPGVTPTGYSDSQAGVPTGAQSLVGSATGTGRTPITFSLGAPLASDLYLNLSKPIIGKLFYASSVTNAQTANARGDGMQLRFELFSGTKRIAGFDYTVTAQTVRNPWGALNFCLRAESRTLDAGQPLTVKITRLTSFADLQIGVGGSQQSYVEVHTFQTDPLAGALYVEGKNLVRLPDQGGDGGNEAFPGLASLPLMALVGLLLRPRRFVVGLAVAVLLGGAMAGCLGGTKPADAADGSEGAKPTVSVTYEPKPTQTTTGSGTPTPGGAVQGLVVNPLGLPIKGAFVIVLETNLEGKETNEKGQFRFDNVTPGTYVFRVDKEGFTSFQDNITVLDGVITKPTITLTYPESKQANDKPHDHDDWNGDKDRVIWTKAYIPEWRYTPPAGTRSDLAAPSPTAAPAGSPAPDPYKGQNCPAYGGGCEHTLELPDNTYILPGTALVELTLQWNKAATGAPQEMSLAFTTATNTSQANRLVSRGPNDAFRIAIFPNEADPGHLKFTDWTFTLRLANIEQNHPFGAPGYTATSVQFTLKIYKGVVPYERAHADFWNGATEIELLKLAALTSPSCLGCDFPSINTYWTPLTGKFVPPDTAELRGTLKWSGTLMSQSALNGAWTIAYRPANVQFRESGLASYPRVTITKTNADNIEFKIIPKTGEPDQYYQKATRWRFLLDDGDKPQKGAYVGYQDVWTLTLTAYKAP